MRVFKILSAFLAVAILSCGICGAAHADYFFWQDAKSGMSLSFPDTWNIVSNQQPDDILTIMAPSGRAHATCRVRLDSDKRYLTYPPDFQAQIQLTAYNVPFWRNYFDRYDDPHLIKVGNSVGFGRNFAGYAIAEYNSAVEGPMMPRKAIAFVSLYYGKVYMLECSSHRDAFDRWEAAFMGIVKSVDFKKAWNENITGNYRNFLDGKRSYLPGDIKTQHVVAY